MSSLLKKRDAYTIYLIEEFAASFLFSMVWTVNLVYQVTIAGLNPLQLVLVGTVLEATAFVFEVPTGVIADVYSRRLSVILGFVLVGAGTLLQGVVPRFEVILLAMVISGIGYTFMSGALEAWIADELGEEHAGAAYLRGAQYGRLGALAGIVPSVLLANVALQLPIVLGASGIIAIGVFLMITMTEHGFKPKPREDRNSFQHMVFTFRGGLQLVRVRRVLITILVIEAIFGAFSEGYDRLWTPHLLQNFVIPKLDGLPPIAWFGIISATSSLLSIAANEFVRRRVDTNSHAVVTRALFAADAIIIVSILTFGLAGNFALAIGAILMLNTSRSTGGPLSMAWMNQSLEPSVRATVFSMRSQFNAFGQIIGGPILGALATLVSLPAAMVVAGVMLAPTLLLYARSARTRDVPVLVATAVPDPVVVTDL